MNNNTGRSRSSELILVKKFGTSFSTFRGFPSLPKYGLKVRKYGFWAVFPAVKIKYGSTEVRIGAPVISAPENWKLPNIGPGPP